MAIKEGVIREVAAKYPEHPDMRYYNSKDSMKRQEKSFLLNAFKSLVILTRTRFLNDSSIFNIFPINKKIKNEITIVRKINVYIAYRSS